MKTAHISYHQFRQGTAVAVLAALAAGLRFFNLASIGYANHYYSAAVLSMTQSWHNFFFVAAEPGGSVSLDKPPLGVWAQAVSAAIFGVNSFGLLLPQLLAGTLSVLLVYALTRRHFGASAGFLAGLMMAVMPSLVAIDRNNTMDSTLIFILLLAAWAFIKAKETGQTRFLMAGAFLVGAGFNVKMLEAFLPLPAFFLFYFSGAKESVIRKLLKLGAATLLILVVSFAWVAIVDLTDSSQRPYVDNSSNNTEFSLVTGYNGMERVMGVGFNLTSGTKGSIFPGTEPPGAMRLFTHPLNKEVSWFLPLGLVGVLVLLFSSRLKWPFSPNHQALMLWGGWFATAGIYLSLSVYIHEYYLSILAPPMAVLSAAGLMQLWQQGERRYWPANALIAAVVGGSLVYQISIAQSFSQFLPWLPALYILFALGVVLIIPGGIDSTHLKKKTDANNEVGDNAANPSLFSQWGRWLAPAGMTCLAGALLLTPGIWAGLTSLYPTPEQMLPMAYDGHSTGQGRLSGLLVDKNLINFLQENTQNQKYLMAVPSSMQGADYVLATGRPVLYIGGFSGLDQAISSNQIGDMVSAGDLRYVYWGIGFRGSFKGTISMSPWLNSNCKVVPGFETRTYLSSVPDGTTIGVGKDVPCIACAQVKISLYDCKK